MTDGLFSAVELDSPGNRRVGFRLDRLELFNWGTFDQRVWSLDVQGDNGLLTGDIGSGKSTIVDAITTLLLPANRISYNKAAGAETRERSLRSYVLGYHKSERSEATGTSRPVGLRGGSTFSVILGVFANAGYGSAVTVAQVFWLKNGQQGQPDRFFVTADHGLSIVDDFADFGGDIAALKRRLRKSGAAVHDHFPEYGKDFRRQLGIESDQAMELFHQTVSMKSVGNLNDFVRSHMLEPFDAAQWTDGLIAHFEDLTKAHEAVRNARDQLADLEPLLRAGNEYDALDEEIRSLEGRRSALPYYFAERKVELLEIQIAALGTTVAGCEQEGEALEATLTGLHERQTQLKIERAGHGGTRLSEIERLVKELDGRQQERRRRHDRFSELLSEAGLAPVEAAEQFTARRQQIETAAIAANDTASSLRNKLAEIDFDARGIASDADEVNTELRSLRNRRSNLPKRSLDLRDWLCRELNLPESELPFAGELIQV